MNWMKSKNHLDRKDRVLKKDAVGEYGLLAGQAYTHRQPYFMGAKKHPEKEKTTK